MINNNINININFKYNISNKVVQTSTHKERQAINVYGIPFYTMPAAQKLFKHPKLTEAELTYRNKCKTQFLATRQHQLVAPALTDVPVLSGTI